jgi:hypothetical protein
LNRIAINFVEMHIAIAPPACKEWELTHVNEKALLNEDSQLLWLPIWLQCWCVWFDACTPCLWQSRCWWYHHGILACGSWCGGLALWVPWSGISWNVVLCDGW